MICDRLGHRLGLVSLCDESWELFLGLGLYCWGISRFFGNDGA
jgi:hypothetical protein